MIIRFFTLSLLVAILAGLVSGCAARTPRQDNGDNSDNTDQVLEELEQSLPAEDKPPRRLREMNHVEVGHWVALLLSVERRLDAETRHRSMNENDFFRLKVRLTKLVDMSMTHYGEFPPDLDFDLRKVISKIDRAIVAYNEPEVVQIVEVPIAKEPSAAMQIGRPFQFSWPLTRIDITSPFGKRMDPFTGRASFHTAVDLAGDTRTLIYAAERGRVVFTGYKGRAGKVVVIQHARGFKTYYAHMSRILTVTGLIVERGQPIGFVGSTGRSTGPHLHFKISHYGRAVDPTKIVGALLE